MGWASCEAREAITKLKFEQRLDTIENAQWARKVYKHLYMKSLYTKWMNRTRKLKFKSQQSSAGAEWTAFVGKKVKEAERKNVRGKNAEKISFKCTGDKNRK
ncbi:uncharacterized protein ISCGN_000308 [Ixodes scapularis]